MEMQVAHVTRIRPAAEGLDKAVGNAGYAGKVDVAATFDMAYGLVGAYIVYSFHIENFNLTNIAIFCVTSQRYAHKGRKDSGFQPRP